MRIFSAEGLERSIYREHEIDVGWRVAECDVRVQHASFIQSKFGMSG